MIFGIYLTNESDEFWTGVTVDVYNETDSATGFKISKNNLSLYLSYGSEINDIISSNITYHKLDSPGASSSLIFSFIMIYNMQIYDFDFQKLIADGSIYDIWGGADIGLSLEGPVEYNDYSAYKITTESLMGFYAVYYVSTVEPYLLINWTTTYSQGKFSSVTLQSVDDTIFSEDEYTNFVNSSRDALKNIGDSDDDIKASNKETNDDKGIPGFEIILILAAIGIILFFKQKK